MLKKTYLILLFASLFIGCSSTKNSFKLEQLPTKTTIHISFNNEKKLFSKIQIPFKLKVENTSNKEQYITSIKYKYDINKKGLTAPFYEETGKKKIKVSFSQKKTIAPHSYKIFCLTAIYLIEANKDLQEQLSIYKEKLTNNSLKIDSELFKSKDLKLYKKIINNDSIIVRTYINSKLKLYKEDAQ